MVKCAAQFMTGCTSVLVCTNAEQRLYRQNHGCRIGLQCIEVCNRLQVPRIDRCSKRIMYCNQNSSGTYLSRLLDDFAIAGQSYANLCSSA